MLLEIGAKVLIADDEQLCRDILSLYLRGLGCQVHVTTNGSDAIAAFKDNADQIDLVVLDVDMPGPGPIGVFESIRSVDPSVPVLFCSGMFADGPTVRPPDAARTAFLPKPFTRDGLREILDGLLTCATAPCDLHVGSNPSRH